MDPPITVRDVFHQYLAGIRECVEVAERCTHRGWPHRKAEVTQAFRLQVLYIERQAQRFDYLYSEGAIAPTAQQSLSLIHERLNETWIDAEEAALVARNPTYQGISTEIAQILVNFDVNAIDGPLQDVQRDADYRSAERILSERAQLSQLAANSPGDNCGLHDAGLSGHHGADGQPFVRCRTDNSFGILYR